MATFLPLPSTAEARFIQLMGGRVLRIPLSRRSIILTLGKTLRRHKLRRRVLIDGRDWLTLGNDIKWGIELDGLRYHNDKIVQQERDKFFGFYGWRVLHVTTTKIRHEPQKVRAEVLEFLAA